MPRSRSKRIGPSCGRRRSTTKRCTDSALRPSTTWTSFTQTRPAGSTGCRQRSSGGSHARPTGLDGCWTGRIGMSSRYTSVKAILRRITCGRITIRNRPGDPQTCRMGSGAGSYGSMKRSTRLSVRSWQLQAATKPKSQCSVTTARAARRTKCCTSIAFWPRKACFGLESGEAAAAR